MTDPRILAFDPSWTQTGWALCRRDGPERVGALTPSRSRRWTDLRQKLAALPVPAIHGVVLEQPGQHGGLHGGRDAATVRGLSLCVGGIALWAAASYGEPWLVEPHAWRRWWGLGGDDRATGKVRAIALVAAQGWGDHGADVAEAILIGVGAARNVRLWGK